MEDDGERPLPLPCSFLLYCCLGLATRANCGVRNVRGQANSSRWDRAAFVLEGHRKMLTARATTITASARLIADSMSISIFAQRLSGIASVGLNAVAFVNET